MLQLVTQLREARKHHQLAGAYQEAQQAEGYATYLVTAIGLIRTEEAPTGAQLLHHSQDMRYIVNRP